MLIKITFAAVAGLALAGAAEASTAGAAAAPSLTNNMLDAKAGALMTMGIVLLNRASRKRTRGVPQR